MTWRPEPGEWVMGGSVGHARLVVADPLGPPLRPVVLVRDGSGQTCSVAISKLRPARLDEIPLDALLDAVAARHPDRLASAHELDDEAGACRVAVVVVRRPDARALAEFRHRCARLAEVLGWT